HPLLDFQAQTVDFQEVRPHSLQHDALLDVDHVRVPDLAPVHDVGHLHARLQFVGLSAHGKDADLACFEIFDDGQRQISHRTNGYVLEHPGLVAAANYLQFVHDRRRDLQARFVGDDGDFFGRQHAQTHTYRI